MEGVREKEKGAPLACVLTDGLTPEHGTVCYHAYWYAQIVIWLNLLSCHVLLLFLFVLIFFSFCTILFSGLSLFPCHHICSSAALVEWKSCTCLCMPLCSAVLRSVWTRITHWYKFMTQTQDGKRTVTWLMMDTSVETNINVGLIIRNHCTTVQNTCVTMEHHRLYIKDGLWATIVCLLYFFFLWIEKLACLDEKVDVHSKRCISLGYCVNHSESHFICQTIALISCP